jgi:predicted MPP superfamily phosphohydrolase
MAKINVPSRPWHSRAFLKHLVWTAASSLQLGGLCPFELQSDWITVNRLPMPIPNLGREFRGARIAHISDLHSSPVVLESYLRKCVRIINGLNVDFVVVTGDLVTGPKYYARGAAAALKELAPRVATLAVLGNHDYGLFHPTNSVTRGLADYIQEQLSWAGVFVLRNELKTFRIGTSTLQFVGLDDYWTQFNPQQAFEMFDPRQPAITLCHNPDAAPALLKYGASWMLAGHTHGKVTPPYPILGRLMPMEQRHLVAGHYRLGTQQHLYINRGLGHSWRVRASDRPEITLLTLCESNAAAEAEAA